MPDRCHPVTVPVGDREETIRLHGSQPPSSEERAALGGLVAAAQNLMAADHYGGIRQDLSMARMRACAELADGETKDRLRDAARAAMAALEEADKLRLVLAELVRLKDGSRDDTYRASKDEAWQRARGLLGEAPPLSPPPHDLTMPHDIGYPEDDVRHCPPNCPYRRWMEDQGWTS